MRIGANSPQGRSSSSFGPFSYPYCYALPPDLFYTLLCPLALYGGSSELVELRKAEVRRIHPLRTRVNKLPDDVTEAEYSPTCLPPQPLGK